MIVYLKNIVSLSAIINWSKKREAFVVKKEKIQFKKIEQIVLTVTGWLHIEEYLRSIPLPIDSKNRVN